MIVYYLSKRALKRHDMRDKILLTIKKLCYFFLLMNIVFLVYGQIQKVQNYKLNEEFNDIHSDDEYTIFTLDMSSRCKNPI